MNRYGAMAAVLTAAAAASLVTPITAEASGNMELRRRVIQLSGILNNGMAGTYATRGEFASMLVNATSYRSTEGGVSSTSVFADVPASSPYASAIRTASEQGWMSGYLGGVFRPDTEITAKEAARALLALENGESQYQLALKIISENYSVRETEKLVKAFGKPRKKKTETEEETDVRFVFQDLEERMRQIRGTKVVINRRDRHKGKVEIEYYSEDELERIVELIETIRE